MRVKTLMGLERFEVEKNSCRRPSDREVDQKVASNQLKIGEQVAYG